MKRIKETFPDMEGFEWDPGNINKNWEKHKVLLSECEETFLNEPLLILYDEKHSTTEQRYHAIGRTNANRVLFISFTIRNKKIRTISARNANKKEKEVYNEEIKRNPTI